MGLRVAICDDEKEICEEIRKRLLSIKPVYEIAIYYSGKELLQEKERFLIVFLNKPIEMECLKEAVLEAEREIASSKKLIIHVSGDIFIINKKDIIYMEAFGDGTYIFLKKGEMIRTTETLKYWFDKVGTEDFFQVHRSYIVAYSHVKGLRKTEVEMDFSKETIPVSRRKRISFKKSLMEYTT